MPVLAKDLASLGEPFTFFTLNSITMAAITIKAFASSDDAEIVWKYPKKITNCWGFAILRQKKGESKEVSDWVKSSVGFEDDTHKEFEFHDTTMWPIQKYSWTDFLVANGDTVRYKVIPMVNDGDKLVKDETNASDWSNWVAVTSDATDAFFNRGQVSSQFVAKRLANLPDKEKKKSLDEHLNDENSPLRTLMGGALLNAVYSILDEPKAAGNADVHLFAALYELNDVVLIKKLNALGKRAHVVLANGAFDKDDKDPQAPNAKLLTKVDLTRRIVGSPHFAHNKFVVLAHKKGKDFIPYKVLTGSTNWTHNGLFTQVNNAVILDDKEVAQYYFAEWNAIHADCNDPSHKLYNQPFRTFNTTSKKNTKGNIGTWFTPTKDLADMAEVLDLIAKAKKGILFLMFKPGTMDSAVLYKAIHARSKEKDPIFVNGVINTDPGGKKTPSIVFMNKGKEEQGSMAILTPSNIKKDFSFWEQELPAPMVTIHSKTILIDPFGDNPILVTGSHNMGNKASKSNDDNLNIIRGNKALAETYAVHMLSVYHHYRWRFYRSQVTNKAGEETSSKPLWKGLVRSDKWQDWFKSGPNKRELDFWMGK